MELKDFQEAFITRVLTPSTPQPWDEAWRPGGRLADVSAVLAMHHRGYIARLTEALGQRYEGMWWVLGDDDFFALCHDYITAKPSERFNLNFYGDDFPEWAARHPLAENIPFLEDLGRFERAFFRLFHAADPVSATPEVFQEFLTGEGGKLLFAEGTEVFESPFAIYDLWQCRKREADCDDPVPDLDVPTRVLLYRFQGAVYVKSFSEEALMLLRRLQSGEGSELLATEDFSPETVTQLFGFLVSSGVVEGVSWGAS